MSLPAITTALLAALLAGCGGGSDDGGSAASTTSSVSAGTGSTAQTASAIAASERCGIDGYQSAMLAEINRRRASAQSCGSRGSFPAAGALSWNDQLFAAAAGHAKDMVARSFFSHTGSSGSSVADRVSAAGYAWSTVAENIALPLIEHAGLSRADAEELAQLKLLLAGLPASAGAKYPAELSGGMIKRAALARALALDPDILFLDEPTAGLDPIGAAAFDQLILTLRDALGLSVFLVTHDLDTLYTICDRVAVLAHKRVLVADCLERVAATDDAWIQAYFHGPRGRAAAQAAERLQERP